MEKIIHRAESRGSANHGWLKANHSFSFANWYNPDRINFGALRVLNDDIIAPKMGFSSHPHDNMEIITIPLEGAVRHKDSMGHSEDIPTGEIQVMSAGSGIVHSEFNASDSEELKLFQIWIFPNKRNVEPRYDQFLIDKQAMNNQFVQLVSPNVSDEGSWIHQDAWIHMAELDENVNIKYDFKKNQNGVYAILVEGEVEVENEILKKRDAIGIWHSEEIIFKALKNSKLLILEVPMNI